MVSFICDACGNTVKKNQVEKHYQQQCRNCSVLSCIDCGVDFPGDSYAKHTSCVSEAEKYQGHLYQAKDNKGDTKQKNWMLQVQQATDTVQDPKLRSLLERIAEYSNVPRKEKKFVNFCRNSLRINDTALLQQLWQAFNSTKQNGENKQNGDKLKDVKNELTEQNEKEQCETKDSEDEDKNRKKSKKNKKRKHNSEQETNTDVNKKRKEKSKKEIGEDEENIVPSPQGKFKWHKAIKTALKEAEGHQLSMKKLRKKVLAAYFEHGTDHTATTMDESRCTFDKKLKTYPKVKIAKEIVTLIK